MKSILVTAAAVGFAALCAPAFADEPVCFDLLINGADQPSVWYCQTDLELYGSAANNRGHAVHLVAPAPLPPLHSDSLFERWQVVGNKLYALFRDFQIPGNTTPYSDHFQLFSLIK